MNLSITKSIFNRSANPKLSESESVESLPNFSNAFLITIGALILGVALFFLSQLNYLIYHTLVELFIVIIGCTIYIVIANSYRFLENHYFFFLGYLSFFISVIDFFHLLSYKGIDLFSLERVMGANLATQLWTADRMVFSVALLIAPIFFVKKTRSLSLFFGFALPTALLLLSIFRWHIFPDAYIDGTGLTVFKKTVEIIFTLVIIFNLFLILRSRKHFSKRVHRFFLFFLLLTLGSEFFFVSYTDVYGINNFLGHYLRLVAYYCLYQAILVTSLVKPYDLLFRNLKQRENELRESKRILENQAEQLQREKDEEEAFLASLGEGIVAVNEEGEIRYVNKSFEHLFDVHSNEVINKSLDQVVSLYDHQGKLVPLSERPIGKVLEKNNSSTIRNDTFTAYHPNGSKVLLSVTVSPIFYGKKRDGAIAVYHDITKEKEIEDIKSDFISIAAHQLRTPLTTISLTAEMMTGNETDYNEETRNYLNDIRAEVKNMTQIIDTFLGISRIELGLLPTTITDENIARLVREWCSEVSFILQNRQINLKINLPDSTVFAETDKNFLKTAFDNILSNAIKYSPENSEIEVLLQTDEANCIIIVKDSGCGIPREQRHRVFEKMFRASNSAGTKGTGLGLYVTKRMIEQIGGGIWFEPNKDIKGSHGTTFYLSIPIKQKE